MFKLIINILNINNRFNKFKEGRLSLASYC